MSSCWALLQDQDGDQAVAACGLELMNTSMQHKLECSTHWVQSSMQHWGQEIVKAHLRNQLPEHHPCTLQQASASFSWLHRVT